MPLTVRARRRVMASPAAARTRDGSLLLDRRRRGHLPCFRRRSLVSVFGYVLLQPRQRPRPGRRSRSRRPTHLSRATPPCCGRAASMFGPATASRRSAGDGMDVLRVERAHRRVAATSMASTYQLRTHAVTIDQLLAEAERRASTGRDSVLQNGVLVSMNGPRRAAAAASRRGAMRRDASPAHAIEIEVRRAVPFIDRRGRREHRVDAPAGRRWRRRCARRASSSARATSSRPTR